MYKSFKHHHGGGIIIFISLWIYIRNGPLKSEKQVKESRSRVAPPILAQAGVGA